MTRYGIDVSVHNGTIDWNKVKNDTYGGFAIIRAGYGREASQKDKQFENNYKGAKEAGIPVGAFWYSYATSVAEAEKEADVCMEILKGKQFEYPIYYDVEEKKAFNTGANNVNAMIKAFCSKLEKAGYWVGVYMSRFPYNQYISEDTKNAYVNWLAEYGSKLNYSGSVGMWQKTSSGSVSGISGDVDLNECYVDYPSLIKENGKNGFSSAASNTVKTNNTVDETKTVNSTASIPDMFTGEVNINGIRYSAVYKRV